MMTPGGQFLRSLDSYDSANTPVDCYDYQTEYPLAKDFMLFKCTFPITCLVIPVNKGMQDIISPPNIYMHRKYEVPGSKHVFTPRKYFRAVNKSVYCTKLKK